MKKKMPNEANFPPWRSPKRGSLQTNEPQQNQPAEGNHMRLRIHKSLTVEHDSYYAPAHNNLGLTLLQSQRHYEAACQFDYAAKPMPHALELTGARR